MGEKINNINKERKKRVSKSWKEEATKYKTLYENLINNINKVNSPQSIVKSKTEGAVVDNPKSAPALTKEDKAIVENIDKEHNETEQPKTLEIVEEKEEVATGEKEKKQEQEEFKCPSCNEVIKEQENPCSKCGAEIGWED